MQGQIRDQIRDHYSHRQVRTIFYAFLEGHIVLNEKTVGVSEVAMVE